MRKSALCVVVAALAALGCGGTPAGAGGGGQGGAITGTGGAITGAGGAGSTSSTTQSSSSASSSSTSTSSTSTSTSTSSTSTSSSSGATCVNSDPGEPNDSEGAAYDFGTIGCDDDDPGMIYGVLAGPDDEDWYTYIGLDENSCLVNPTHGLTVLAGTARVCAFFACTGGSGTDVGGCPSGTTDAKSPAGRPGCCGSGEFTVDLNCTGTIDDEAAVYLRVDDPTHQAVCTEYAVSFHY